MYKFHHCSSEFTQEEKSGVQRDVEESHGENILHCIALF